MNDNMPSSSTSGDTLARSAFRKSTNAKRKAEEENCDDLQNDNLLQKHELAKMQRRIEDLETFCFGSSSRNLQSQPGRDVVTLNDVSSLNLFLADMTNKNGNLFMNKTIVLHGQKPNCLMFWERVEHVLGKIGKYLRYVDIRLVEAVSHFAFYKILKKCLPHLPKLIGLIVDANIIQDPDAFIWESYILENNLPTLFHLQSLEFNCKSSPILNELLRRCPKLTKLGYLALPKESSSLVTLKRLEELDISFQPRLDPSIWYHGLYEVHKNLEMLSVTFEYVQKFTNVIDLPKLVKRFENLKHLQLEGCIALKWIRSALVASAEGGSCTTLYLPKWKHTKIQQITVHNRKLSSCSDISKVGYKFYFHLLCHFPNVVVVHIIEDCDKLFWSGGVHKDMRFPLHTDTTLGSLYASEIWSMLQSLETVIVEVNACKKGKITWTREGYNNFKKYNEKVGPN